jgi:hypothetical protein
MAFTVAKDRRQLPEGSYLEAALVGERGDELARR